MPRENSLSLGEKHLKNKYLRNLFSFSPGRQSKTRSFFTTIG
jgi:hypothetical protein